MSQSTTRWDTFTDLLKLSEAEFKDLLAIRQNMNQAWPNAAAAVSDARIARRVCVRGALWLPAEIRETSGNFCRVRAYPVDLSTSGMCLLVDRFLNDGSAWLITFQMMDNETFSMKAVSVRCRLLRGRAHEVAVRFETPFDLSLLAEGPEGNSTTIAGRATDVALATPARSAAGGMLLKRPSATPATASEVPKHAPSGSVSAAGNRDNNDRVVLAREVLSISEKLTELQNSAAVLRQVAARLNGLAD